MSYRALSDNLHTTADSAKAFFAKEYGLNKFNIEKAINSEIEFAPTLHIKTNDHYILCIDVSMKVISSPLFYFITECEKLSLPVKLYVALPKNTKYGDYVKDIKKAKKMGIGIVEINHNNGNGEIIHRPLSLSLTCLRAFDKGPFPNKYKGIITDAVETFKGGDPNGGCSIIFQEVETLTRRIAYKTYKMNLWKQTISKPTDLKKIIPWASVVNMLKSNLDRNRNPLVKNISDNLLSKVHGMTSSRNDSAHKPNNSKALIARDTKLRTRMEHAVDTLLELYTASKGIRP